MRAVAVQKMMTMVASRSYSANEVSQVEKDIRSGNTKLIKNYADDALQNYADSVDVLNHRKKIIWNACNGEVEGLQYFAILSVLTDDRAGWDVALEILGDALDPALGYTAYHYLSYHQADTDIKNRWHFLLTESANLGHFHARRIVFEEQTLKYGLFKYPLLMIHRIWLTICAIPIVVANRNDSRLPRSTMNSGDRQPPSE